MNNRFKQDRRLEHHDLGDIDGVLTIRCTGSKGRDGVAVSKKIFDSAADNGYKQFLLVAAASGMDHLVTLARMAELFKIKPLINDEFIVVLPKDLGVQDPFFAKKAQAPVVGSYADLAKGLPGCTYSLRGESPSLRDGFGDNFYNPKLTTLLGKMAEFGYTSCSIDATKGTITFS